MNCPQIPKDNDARLYYIEMYSHTDTDRCLFVAHITDDGKIGCTDDLSLAAVLQGRECANFKASQIGALAGGCVVRAKEDMDDKAKLVVFKT